MRVIHPEDFKALPKKKKKAHKSALPFLVVIVALLAGGYYWYSQDNSQQSQSSSTEQNQSTATSSEKKAKTGMLKEFTGEEFKTLARSVKYPNTQQFDEPPTITGNKVADARIREIAATRGYVLTSIPVTVIEKINEPRLDGDDLLQPLAAIAWRELKAAATKDNIPISLLSAYRSPDYQRKLFVSRLLENGGSVAAIATGTGDAAVVETMEMTAIPGYSRHHTGYTIDLWCEDGSGAFVNSSCYRWIKANNYKIAKQNGWVPSYPDGVKLQGPEPEPWEYVWVSKDLVTE